MKTVIFKLEEGNTNQKEKENVDKNDLIHMSELIGIIFKYL